MKLVDAEPFIRDLTAMKSMYDAIALDGMIKALEDAKALCAEDVLSEMVISVNVNIPKNQIEVRLFYPDNPFGENSCKLVSPFTINGICESVTFRVPRRTKDDMR